MKKRTALCSLLALSLIIGLSVPALAVAAPLYSVPLALPSTQTVLVDGKAVEFQAYALTDRGGNRINYIKLRDLALVLNGTAAQFNVAWDGEVNIETGKPYIPDGTEMSSIFYGRQYYKMGTAPNVNGVPVALESIVLADDEGAYSYYKLRDLGAVLGFGVDWSAKMGISIDTTHSSGVETEEYTLAGATEEELAYFSLVGKNCMLFDYFYRYYYRIANQTANLRSEFNTETDANIIETIPQNTEVQVLGEGKPGTPAEGWSLILRSPSLLYIKTSLLSNSEKSTYPYHYPKTKAEFDVLPPEEQEALVKNYASQEDMKKWGLEGIDPHTFYVSDDWNTEEGRAIIALGGPMVREFKYRPSEPLMLNGVSELKERPDARRELGYFEITYLTTVDGALMLMPKPRKEIEPLLPRMARGHVYKLEYKEVKGYPGRIRVPKTQEELKSELEGLTEGQVYKTVSEWNDVRKRWDYKKVPLTQAEIDELLTRPITWMDYDITFDYWEDGVLRQNDFIEKSKTLYYMVEGEIKAHTQGPD